MFLGALLASLATLPHISKCAACAPSQRASQHLVFVLLPSYNTTPRELLIEFLLELLT